MRAIDTGNTRFNYRKSTEFSFLAWGFLRENEINGVKKEILKLKKSECFLESRFYSEEKEEGFCFDRSLISVFLNSLSGGKVASKESFWIRFFAEGRFYGSKKVTNTGRCFSFLGQVLHHWTR